MESFGYTAIEAMSYKLPVVASKIGGLKEIIMDNENGYLIDKKNVNDFAKKILDLISNPEKMNQFGNSGYERYKKNFTGHAMANNYMNLMFKREDK